MAERRISRWTGKPYTVRALECRNGHPRTAENTVKYPTTRGNGRCLDCVKAANARRPKQPYKPRAPKPKARRLVPPQAQTYNVMPVRGGDGVWRKPPFILNVSPAINETL